LSLASHPDCRAAKPSAAAIFMVDHKLDLTGKIEAVLLAMLSPAFAGSFIGGRESSRRADPKIF
jgi:hypothetical protein